MKAEDIRSFHVADANWLTEHVVVVGVKTAVHGKAVLESVKAFFNKLPADDDLFEHPRISGSPDSGWTVIDSNSIVVHCVAEDQRVYYAIDALFESQGHVYHY